MKKLLSFALVLVFTHSFAQDKLIPPVKKGTRFTYVVHSGGQDVNFSAMIDSVAPGYMKLSWDIDGVGSGAWVMKQASLDKATNGYWDEPQPGSEVVLSDNQTILVLSKAQWEALQRDKKLVFDQQNFVVKSPSEQQLLKLQGKTVDATLLEAANSYRIWVLNNPAFPFILKIEGNPKGIDADLTSID